MESKYQQEPEAISQHGTCESRTTTEAGAIANTDPPLPMILEAAEAFWRALAALMQRNIAHLGPIKAAWIIGQHGDMPVVLALHHDGHLEIWPSNTHPALRALPRFTCHAGRHSLVQTLRSNSPSQLGTALEWHGTAEQLDAVLHAFFIFNATKPLPANQPLEIYDASKKTLRIGSAESVATDAFKQALNAAKPSDKIAFADSWARAAFAHLTNEGTDHHILTKGGVNMLDMLRDCNVHRTRHDLVAQAPAISCLLRIEEEGIRLRAALQPEGPYLNARRAYLAAFRQAHALALSAKANHPRAFSQRLIKGLLLAQVSPARLVIGSLFQTISPALAARYGKALPFMQSVEVVALGRPSSEVSVRKDVTVAAGIFRILDEHRAILDPPRVLFPVPLVLVNPGNIFHEFQHVRQHMAAEVSIDDFQPQELFEDEVTECKAKQAEAGFIAEFGILY